MTDDERALRCLKALGNSNRTLRLRLVGLMGTGSSRLLSAIHEAEAILTKAKP